MRDAILSEYDGVSPQNNWYMDMGDIVEAITLNDPRYDPESHKNYSPVEQIGEAVEDYMPISKKIIGILDGNHPLKLWRVVPGLTKHICKLLDCPFGDYSAKIAFKDMYDNYLFKIFTTHGRKSINSNLPDPAQRWAAMQRGLKNALRRLADDCIVMVQGHSHQLVHVEPHRDLFLYDDSGSLKQGYLVPTIGANYISPDLRWYINSGSFFKTQMEGFSTYAEQAQYAPSVMGYYVLKIRDFEPVGVDRITV